jgi:hypothetical protein
VHYPIPVLGDPPVPDGSRDLMFGSEILAPPLAAAQTYTASSVENRGFEAVIQR